MRFKLFVKIGASASAVCLALLGIGVASASADPGPDPSPTATASPSPTDTAAPAAADSPSPSPSDTPDGNSAPAPAAASATEGNLIFGGLDDPVDAVANGLDTLGGLQADLPALAARYYTCTTPPLVTYANQNNPGVYASVKLIAALECTANVKVRIYNFYIHSNYWGDSTGVHGCDGNSGECTARIPWTASRPFQCNTSGTMVIPYSMNFYTPKVGNDFYQGSISIHYQQHC